MKKIIFIHLLNSYTGSPKVLAQIIKICKKNGYETDLYIGEKAHGFLPENANYYFYKRFKNKYSTLLFYLISQFILFFKLLRYKKQDAIFYVNALLPFGALLAGKLLNKRVYCHVHETALKPIILHKFLRCIVQLTANKVIFVSNSLKEAEYFRSKEEFVIYNALEDNFLRIAKKHNYKWKFDNVFNVLMICSLKPYKGITEFIEIAKQCQPNKSIQFTLVLSVDQNEINVFFDNLLIPSNVSLVPCQAEVISYYQKTSLLLNLSHIDEWVETFGLTLIEAMAFGIPVIAPPIGGPSEIVTDNVNGYLISSYDIEKISQRILELESNKQLCLELSHQAKIIPERFNEEIFEKDILKLFN